MSITLAHTLALIALALIAYIQHRQIRALDTVIRTATGKDTQ